MGSKYGVRQEPLVINQWYDLHLKIIADVVLDVLGTPLCMFRKEVSSPPQRGRVFQIRKRFGQSSVEYIVITAFSLMLITLVVMVFYTYTHQTSDQIIQSQTDALGQSIIANAETVYFYGPRAKMTLDITFPLGVKRMYIVNKRELAFDLQMTQGNATQVYFSRINITGTFTAEDFLPGKKQFRLRTQGDEVIFERMN